MSIFRQFARPSRSLYNNVFHCIVIFTRQTRVQLMKILLLHPRDRAEDGPWQHTHWDWIVDLGWAGHCTYIELAERLGCEFLSIRNILDHRQHLSSLRDLWKPGLGRLVDDENIDWWDAFFPLPYAQIEEILLVSSLAQHIPNDAEIVATRSHLLVRALSQLLGREIRPYTAERNSRFTRYRKAAATFRPAQIMDIALDKWDADYRFRRHTSPAAPTLTESAVLLPSSYVNVSRAQVDYARMLPQQRFLLVVTRRNGGLLNLPANVKLRALASYAPKPFLAATEKEYARLMDAWRTLQPKLSEASSALNLANKLNVFHSFPAFLQKGLRIRDAWRAVLSREPIQSVLSGDENNAFTRLPTLLARTRGIHTVVCEHGALNMGFALRPAVSEICLARGEMGRDYWKEFCNVQHSRMLVGSSTAQPNPRTPGQKQDWIVFFSEEYELSSGRTEDFYRQLLPKLVSLANNTGRKVVIKLHPFESLRERTRFVNQVLPVDLIRLVELRDGPLTPDLIDRAWFTLTVESSVAVESTLKGVPCFLCHWFDSSWYEYGIQFAKFSAGHILNSPEEILDIPKRLKNCEITPAIRQRLATQIRPEELQAILSGTFVS